MFAPTRFRAPEPRLLPEDEAPGLTASVGSTVAAMFKMDRVVQPPTDVGDARWSIYLAAGLPSSPEHLKALTAILGHLRHERQTFKTSMFVERRKNLFLAPHFYPVPCPDCHDQYSFGGELLTV